MAKCGYNISSFYCGCFFLNNNAEGWLAGLTCTAKSDLEQISELKDKCWGILAGGRGKSSGKLCTETFDYLLAEGFVHLLNDLRFAHEDFLGPGGVWDF